MDERVLQSLISSTRNKINDEQELVNFLEGRIIQCKQFPMVLLDLNWHYKEVLKYKKKIAKLVVIQKALKKEIKAYYFHKKREAALASVFDSVEITLKMLHEQSKEVEHDYQY